MRPTRSPRPPGRFSAPTTLFATLLLSFAAPAQGRGDYLNVESPQVSPIAVTQFAGRTLLLVCNTPDNAVEVWDTHLDAPIGTPTTPTFVQRVAVGLEPVSVVADGDRFWTANFLGDSVTACQLENPSTGLRALVRVSRNLPAPAGYQRGDEPMDLALFDDQGTQTLVVSLNTGSAVAWLDAATLLPHGSGTVDVVIPQLPPPNLAAPHGIKEPRAVRVANGRVFVLATKGGVTDPTSVHDLDVLAGRATGGSLVFDLPIANLGSTNMNMRFDSNGDLWVVGGEAQNFITQDKIEVRAQSGTPPLLPPSQHTGFVKSALYRLQFTTAPVPAVTRTRRDLNLTSAGSVVTKLPPFPQGRPAAMPTDLALFEQGNQVTKVYVAAMSSDRICVLTQPAGGSNDIALWTRGTIDLPGTTLNGGPRFGPRGLTLVERTVGSTTRRRLYAVNRLDNSVVAIDATADALLPGESFALRHEPTPADVRQGRRFLYDADLSDSGFVSCSSCHVDGRTDGLAWRLGNPNGTGPHEAPPNPNFILSIGGTGTISYTADTSQPLPFPSTMLGDVDYQRMMRTQGTFDPAYPANPPFLPADPSPEDDKREMVTQSLQGLLNFEVERDAQSLVTNAPYHWRGDKPSLREFNEAFETLLGAAHAAVSPGVSDPNARGLTDAQMDSFETFVFSITYPPNPKQANDRTYADNTAAAAGLALFHTTPTSLAERSCVHCHPLPEGSNNRLTVFDVTHQRPGFVTRLNRQPIESAALRGLLQKEPLLESGGTSVSHQAPIVGHTGASHSGLEHVTAPTHPTLPVLLTSINTFIDLFGLLPPHALPAGDLALIKQFVHEIDWGVAPTVGRLAFFNQAILLDFNQLMANALALQDMFVQADVANAGLVLWITVPSVRSTPFGLRWSTVFQRWIEEGGPNIATTDQIANVLIQSPDNTVAVMSVPLGSERRIAFSGGSQPPTPIDILPANVDFVGLVTNTAYQTVPTLVDNWIPQRIGGAPRPGEPPPPFAPFDFAEVLTNHSNDLRFFGSATLADDVFTKTMRLFQIGLLPAVTGRSYGLPFLRHEAPRRIRIRGDGIMVGARLVLSIPDAPSTFQPTPRTWNTLANPPYHVVKLPLHPLSMRIANQTVWETAVEFDPLIAYILMLGGPRAPGVPETLIQTIQAEYDAVPTSIVEPTSGPPFATPLPFDPNEWNWYGIQVENPHTAATPGPLLSPMILRQLIML